MLLKVILPAASGLGDGENTSIINRPAAYDNFLLKICHCKLFEPLQSSRFPVSCSENILIPAFYLLSRYFFDTRITFNCEKSPAGSLQKKTGYFMRFE